MRKSRVCVFVGCLIGWPGNPITICYSQETPIDIRRTATVVAVEKVQPAVAAVYAYGDQKQGTGSGSVIDPRGYVLTAKHVALDRHIVLLGGRPPLQATLIGTMPEFDVAILKLGEPAFNRPGSPIYPRAALPQDYVRLGVDDDVRMGETILNIGSPGGRGIVVTQGIISAVAFTGVNPLAVATQSSTAFDEMLQFDAASNPGNSGGAVVNLSGEQIGMAVSGIPTEEGIHFALPLKTIRQSIPAILNSEMRHRYTSGIAVDPQAKTVMVIDVAEHSPAATAGIRIGDQIVSVDGRELRDPVDWEFTRFEWRSGDQFTLGIHRGEQSLEVTMTLADRVGQAGVAVQSAEPGLTCRFAAYDPQIADPLDDDRKPSGESTVITTVQPKPASATQDDHYELVIEGLLKIDQAGIYRLGLRSDDGSRLFVHDRLLVDNGGNHAPIDRTVWVDLDAGWHPIRIEFYEDEGGQELEFLMAQGDAEISPVGPDRLFHSAAKNENGSPTNDDTSSEK